MITIAFTYQKITPESAEQGDYSEHGFYEPGGWFYPIEECKGSGAREPWRVGDLRRAIESARDLGICEPSQCPKITSGHAWFSSVDPDRDYRTGEETTYSLHIDGATVATLNRIARVLGHG